MQKNRTIAALLSLFLGGLGAHWFYLNRNGLGILHAIFLFTPFPWISGFVSAIVWLSMDDAKFEQQYLNTLEEKPDYQKFDTDYQPKRRSNRKTEYLPPVTRPQVNLKINRQKALPFINAGKAFFKEYDIPAAIEQFEKALELDPHNAAIHFNLACAYSLSEKTDRSIYHLEEAVRTGFDDFDKIKTHDALAYLRIQPEFNTFEANWQKTDTPKQVNTENNDNLLDSTPDLLDQLKKLQLMRQTGQITEKVFQTEKRKLFS